MFTGSLTTFACEHAHLEDCEIPLPLVALAVRRCCFLLESAVESLSNAKLGLTLVPAGQRVRGSQLTENPGRAKTQTHKGAHVVGA